MGSGAGLGDMGHGDAQVAVVGQRQRDHLAQARIGEEGVPGERRGFVGLRRAGGGGGHGQGRAFIAGRHGASGQQPRREQHQALVEDSHDQDSCAVVSAGVS
jgi:hypothetical protein